MAAAGDDDEEETTMQQFDASWYDRLLATAKSFAEHGDLERATEEVTSSLSTSDDRGEHRISKVVLPPSDAPPQAYRRDGKRKGETSNTNTQANDSKKPGILRRMTRRMTHRK